MIVLRYMFYFLCFITLINAMILVVFGTVWVLNYLINDWFGIDIAHNLIDKWGKKNV